jgi:hypothetical protein
MQSKFMFHYVFIEPFNTGQRGDDLRDQENDGHRDVGTALDLKLRNEMKKNHSTKANGGSRTLKSHKGG